MTQHTERFLVFSGFYYSVEMAGWSGFVGDYKTVEDAKLKCFEELEDGHDYSQLVDLQGRTITTYHSYGKGKKEKF